MYVKVPCLFCYCFQAVNLIISCIDISSICTVLLYQFRSRMQVCALQTSVAKAFWSPTI